MSFVYEPQYDEYGNDEGKVFFCKFGIVFVWFSLLCNILQYKYFLTRLGCIPGMQLLTEDAVKLSPCCQKQIKKIWMVCRCIPPVCTDYLRKHAFVGWFFPLSPFPFPLSRLAHLRRHARAAASGPSPQGCTEHANACSPPALRRKNTAHGAQHDRFVQCVQFFLGR